MYDMLERVLFWTVRSLGVLTCPWPANHCYNGEHCHKQQLTIFFFLFLFSEDEIFYCLNEDTVCQLFAEMLLRPAEKVGENC